MTRLFTLSLLLGLLLAGCKTTKCAGCDDSGGCGYDEDGNALPCG